MKLSCKKKKKKTELNADNSDSGLIHPVHNLFPKEVINRFCCGNDGNVGHCLKFSVRIIAGKYE